MTGDYQVAVRIWAYHARVIDVQSKCLRRIRARAAQVQPEADKLAKKGIVMSQLQKQLGPRGYICSSQRAK